MLLASISVGRLIGVLFGLALCVVLVAFFFSFWRSRAIGVNFIEVRRERSPFWYWFWMLFWGGITTYVVIRVLPDAVWDIIQPS